MEILSEKISKVLITNKVVSGVTLANTCFFLGCILAFCLPISYLGLAISMQYLIMQLQQMKY